MRLILLIYSLLLFISCEKKELPVSKHNRGDVITAQVEMTSNYKNQIWFRLTDNTIVFTNLKTDWDLGFESSQDGYHVVLNNSKAMKAYRTGFSNLSEVNDTIGIGANGLADMPSGNLDSTAIGNWQTNTPVYIINRGYNEVGVSQGFYKLRIINSTAGSYTFEYGDIYGTSTITKTVYKNALNNFDMFSFASGESIQIEPKKIDYDLCFTQYSHVYYNPIHFYLVTGVLSNGFNTSIARITNKLFNDISISDTANYNFSKAKNAIGYDWKTFDLNNNLFTVNANICFIIKDSKGFFYKLHFIDFYNQAGVKGNPTWEYQQL